jgi:multidrug resistance efflux pump
MSRRESQADALLLRRPRRAAGSVYLLALLLTAALVWACLTPVDVFVRAPGVVRPEGDVIRIVGETGGRILRVEGREGDFVGTGDVLIQLDSALSRARLAALDEQIALREDQLGRLGSRLAAADEIHRTELARLDAEIRSETAALERRRKDHESRMLASGILLERARYDYETTQTLFEEGLVSFETASRSRAEFRLAELEYDRVGLERPDGSEIEILETSRNATAARFTSELEETELRSISAVLKCREYERNFCGRSYKT